MPNEAEGNLARLDLRRLHLLRRVIEEGSFSRAAAVLGITQPALSRQIRALEAELGTALLYRHGRGVVATEEGRRFAEAVAPVLEALARIRADAIAARGVPRGRVTVAMPPSVAAAFGPALVRHLRAELPEVECHILDAFTGTLHEWLSSGRVDLAVLNPHRSSAALRTEPLFDAALHLVHPAGDPEAMALREGGGGVPLAAAARLPLLLPGRHHGLRREIEAALAAEGLAAARVQDVDSLAALRHLLAEGLGYTLAAWDAFALELAGGQLDAAPIVAPRLRHAFVLATSGERAVSPAARAVMGFLRAEVRRRAEAGTLRGWAPGVTPRG